MSQQRHLAAILFTDIVGYTALMQEDEQKAVALIKHYNTSLNNLVTVYGGKVLNYYGDGSLCSFTSATQALTCAIELQKQLQSDPIVPLRIGLHIGEVLFEDGQALGDGVNVASRIQSLGQANTILFSKEIADKIRNHPEFNLASLGSFDFKNLDEPVEVFALTNEGLVVPKREQMHGKLKKGSSNGKYRNLKRLVAIVSVLILITSGIFLYLGDFRHQHVSVEKSIAVLPFVNMSSDANQEFFADGMMDEILNHLYKIGGLKVTSRTSSVTYKGSKKTSTEIANELGVANLLECSVQKDGDRIRIIAQLINGRTDDHLWAETYDRDFKDIFSIQSEIAQQIASALKIKIDPTVKERIETKPTNNTDAYSLYLRAKNAESEKSKLYYEAAIELDSTFAAAYIGLAYYWIFGGLYSGSLTPQEVLTNAEPLLKKAIGLNPNLAQIYGAQACIDLWYKWDFESVKKGYQKVLELDPSNPDTYNTFNFYLLSIGEFQQSLENSSKAFKNDSLSNRNWVDLALSNYFNGNNKAALEIITNCYLQKNDWYTWDNYIRICLDMGEYEKAVLAYEKYKSAFSGHTDDFVLGHAAVAYYKTGHKDSTEKLLDILKAKSLRSTIGSPSNFIAAIYTGMGEKDLAIQWLQKAYRDHEVELYWLKIEPLFNSLHNDPRFKDLQSKIGFK